MKIMDKETNKNPHYFLKGVIVLGLLILNLSAIGLFYYAKQGATSIADSFKSAVNDTSRWSSITASADFTLPAKDVAGEDLIDTSRYPGSMRTNYQKTETETLLAYQSLEKPDKVLQYLKTQLAKNGWILKKASETDATFIKDKNTIELAVNQGVSQETIYTITKK